MASLVCKGPRGRGKARILTPSRVRLFFQTQLTRSFPFDFMPSDIPKLNSLFDSATEVQVTRQNDSTSFEKLAVVVLGPFGTSGL